ncbi:MAG: hypothetical protein J6Z23_07135 [Lachnospiraceae bacterium]|nr:hypothetical protein [Lachnospiraceae bacterium]
MTGRKIRAGISILLHLFILAVTVRAVVSFFVAGGDGNMRVYGWPMFRYFTVDSNILLALSGIPVIVKDVRILAGTDTGLNRWETLFAYVGTAATTLTFTVVMVFLGPVFGFRLMFLRNNLFLHLISPLLAVAALCFLDHGYVIGWKEGLLGMIPCVVYGLVYFTEVVIIGQENGGWPDLYALNAGGRWYISMAAMFSGMLLLCVILTALARKTGAGKDNG